MHGYITRKEQDFLDKTETWKVSHIQELKKLKQKHSQVTTQLQETIATLDVRDGSELKHWSQTCVFQLKLGDEQALLCEVKRQQLKFLDDQQKVYADDLSRLVCMATSVCNNNNMNKI